MSTNAIDGFLPFLNALRDAGFSVSGGAAEGGIALSGRYAPNIRWHTGEDTDPWLWRMRVLQDCDDIAYAKVFLGKGGWITRAWYPYFLAIRREGRTFDEMYDDGLIGQMEARIYRAIEESGEAAFHTLKRAIGVERSDAARFEVAIRRLQMLMLITISGETQRIGTSGAPFGWPITEFCTVERFFGEAAFDESCRIDREEAIQKIAAQVRAFNPAATEREIARFIG